MFISVVIATRNRRVLLARTLDALARQTWPRDDYEVIVADNGSTDDTRGAVAAAAAEHDLRIVYLRVDTPGKSHAVNAAFERARGDVFALTDDDVVPEPEWLAQLAEAFSTTDAQFVAGRILPIWESEPPAWMSPALHGVLAIPDNGPVRLAIQPGGSEMVVPIGANMAVRASIVRRIGGLRVDLGKLEGTLRTGEDHEFFLRMLHNGFAGLYEPTAVVHHQVSADRLQRSYFRRWLFQNGRDVAVLDAAFPVRATRLLGVPRYLWRQAAYDVAAAVGRMFTGDAASRFASQVRLVWFGGYLRESWFAARRARRAALELAAQ